MKNIHILPTDKPSRLFKDYGKLGIGGYATTREALSVINQNIYITSDEEIKVGDYRYSLLQNNFELVSEFSLKVNKEYWKLNNQIHKKIILTTDQDLIEDGVQSIDNEFLEWFVKNPSCEEVEIKSWIKTYEDGSTFDRMDYEIIIPKEESKQETLEQLADKWVFETNGHKWSNNNNEAGDNFGSFIAGFKEAEKTLYSKEDMKEAYFSAIESTGEGWNGEYAEGNNPNIEDKFSEGFKEWFEKFKKK